MGQSELNRIEVTIFGQVYRIAGSESPQQIKALALEIDKKMKEISSAAPSLDIQRIAVLASMNIANECSLKLGKVNGLTQQLSLLETEYLKALGQLDPLKHENSILIKDLDYN